MRKVVELARNLIYTLRSMSIPIKCPARIIHNNEFVVDQTSKPGSPQENKVI